MIFRVGIRAGRNICEHEAYGWDFPSHALALDRLEKAGAMIRALFHAEGRIDFDGRYYTLKHAAFAPRPGR